MKTKTITQSGYLVLMYLCMLAEMSVVLAKEYSPDTRVYSDALWMRVHAEDCPQLILKEKKKTMTLEDADKFGWRIGESGQSGRDNCCLHGYKRKHPVKKIPEDSLGVAQVMKKGPLKWHLSGCHRFVPISSYQRVTLKDAKKPDYRICEHCIERGPSLTTISDEGWKNLPAAGEIDSPAGWEPKALSSEKLPSKKDVEMLVLETLNLKSGIQERQYENPVATVENFMTLRFFFPVENWLHFYKAYRATGDKRILDKLRDSAQNYNKLSTEYLSAAQSKASDPEGMSFMYSMAAYSRFTLQLGRKDINLITEQELKEAETFLETMISVLKPTCEGTDSLDPRMGIPQKLADDFRSRAPNRSMNGIGTLSMIAAALEDLQALKKTKQYQPQIDCYRKVIREFISHWTSIGHFCTKIEGEEGFYYPYSINSGVKIVDGCKIYKRTEDGGHYSHTLQGLMCIYESTPELGIDDDFMTAVANAVHYSRSHKIKKGKKEEWSGHIQCPTALRVKPQGGESGHHSFRKGPGSERFYMLEAFRGGVLDALAKTATEGQLEEANSNYERRVATLHLQYLKALRKDRRLVYLGEKN